MPPTTLPASDGRRVELSSQPASRTVLYCYPSTGRPGEASLTPDWDLISGARGCTPESCSFRDRHDELGKLGAEVFGLSTQDSDYQREAASRLRLPFPLLSDAHLELSCALRLPTFTVAVGAAQAADARRPRRPRGASLASRLPPDRHADEVLAWLRRR